ncbi:MAG: PCMD domain-containing protein, partial [Paramuribaculum sp.]|nr:PCMD domain-containing protein [Paramuribaculum sp.]
EIRTNPKNRQLFDPNDPTVVAYGCLESGESIAEFTDIEFTLDYRGNYSRQPKQIILVCAASKYGAYFTGGGGSTLEVENIELLYDY